MVEQLVFGPIWRIYEAAASGRATLGDAPAKQGPRDPQQEDERVLKLCEIARALGLKETEQLAAELRRRVSPKRHQRALESSKETDDLIGELVTAVMSRWIPVGEEILVS